MTGCVERAVGDAQQHLTILEANMWSFIRLLTWFLPLESHDEAKLRDPLTQIVFVRCKRRFEELDSTLRREAVKEMNEGVLPAR